MAITADKSPYKLTAQGDNLASVFQGRDMYDPTPVVRYKCYAIHVIAGASGDCILLDKPGGEIIYVSKNLNAGDESKWEPGCPVWFDGCYVQALPASSVVLLYIGN